jgi:hypothetical protein
MNGNPETISLQNIMERADRHYLASDHKWMLWIWRNIVLLRPTGSWSVEDTSIYVNLYWNIFDELRKSWPAVFYVIDMNHMDIQTEEFRRYLKENWAHLLDRADLGLCFVESRAMKRLIWGSIFQLIGKRERLFLFRDFTEALAWIAGQQGKPAGRASGQRSGQA